MSEEMYLGKFKSKEEIERAYEEAEKKLREMQEVSANANKELGTLREERERLKKEQDELKNKMESVGKAPDRYQISTDHAAKINKDALESKAKSLGYTQAQFDKLVNEEVARVEQISAKRDAMSKKTNAAEIKKHLEDLHGKEGAELLWDNMTDEQYDRYKEQVNKSLDGRRQFSMSDDKPQKSQFEIDKEIQEILAHLDFNHNDQAAKNRLMELCRMDNSINAKAQTDALANQIAVLQLQLQKLATNGDH